MTHRHVRPAIADQRAALAVATAILTGAKPAAAHEAATPPGTCPACVAVAGISLVITLASTLAGDQLFVSEPLARAMLALVETAQRELEAIGN